MAKIPYVTLWHTSQMRLINTFVLPHTGVENLALNVCIIYLILFLWHNAGKQQKKKSSCNKSIKYPVPVSIENHLLQSDQHSTASRNLLSPLAFELKML